jgi:integrase/recombinase XerD
MRKPWICRRKGRPGKYVEWYDEDGRRRSKYFAPKRMKFATPYLEAKLLQLNTDCLAPGQSAGVPYDEAVKDYIRHKKVGGLARASIVEIEHTLEILGTWAQIETTRNIDQRLLDDFVLHRQEDKGRGGRHLSPGTLNKDLRNLRAFLIWAHELKYIRHGLKAKSVKAPRKPVRVLRNDEIRALVQAAPSTVWRLRILLMAGMGMRRGDIDKIKIADIDLHSKTIRVSERKTGKASVRIIPDALIQPMTDYIVELPTGTTWLLRPSYNRTQWLRIVASAKVAPIPTPHDLRRSYATLQAVAGTPMHIVQSLLAHSNIETTMASYIAGSDEEAQKAANRLKIVDWIT